MSTQSERPRVLYFYDALCGWCYGFRPVIEKLAENYSDQVYFRVVAGGMVQGDAVGPIGEVADYIPESYPRVEATTGVKFGEAFLQNVMEPGTAIFSSEPSVRALVTFKNYNTKDALAYAGRMQEAIYRDGMEPTDWKGYAKLAGEFGLPVGAFEQRMKSDKVGEEAAEEVSIAARVGVQSYPVVLLNYGDNWALLAKGYVPYEKLEAALKAGLEEVLKDA